MPGASLTRVTDDEILAQLEFHADGDDRQLCHNTMTCGCHFIWPQWFALQVALYALDQHVACFRCGREPVHVSRSRPVDERFYAPLEALEFDPVIECCMPSAECYHFGSHPASWHCVMRCGCSRFVCDAMLEPYRHYLSENHVLCSDCDEPTSVVGANAL